MPMIAVCRKQQGKRVSPRRIVMEQLRIRTNYERKLERQVFNLLERTSRDSSKAFAESGRIPEITSFASELRSILDPHYRDVLEKFALMVLENQKQTPAIDRLIQQFLKTQGANAIRNITSSTRSKINSIIRKGNRSGSSVDSIARSIREGTGGLIARNRAATIARTETHNAASFAQMEIAKDSLPQDGLMKQWVSVGDNRTRNAHVRANGQLVGIDEKFELVVGGIKYFMDRPADPNGGPANVINCRCAVVFVYPEDEVDETRPLRSKEKPWLYEEGVPAVDMGFFFDENGAPYSELPIFDDVTVRLNDLSLIGPNGRQTGKEFGLTAIEASILTNYSRNSYIGINELMRQWFYGEKEISLPTKEFLVSYHTVARDALRKLPKFEGQVTRGIKVKADEFLAKNPIEEGGVLRAESFYSTSRKQTVSSGFTGDVAYVIQSKSGRQIDSVAYYHDTEAEVLFPAGTEFRITKINRDNTPLNDRYRASLVIEMEEIDSEIKNFRLLDSLSEIKQAQTDIAKRLLSEENLMSYNNVLMD